jgi:polar amino acid transport system permease protein
MAYDWSAVLDALLSLRLLEGAWTTVWLSVLCMALGFVGGVVVAAMRESPLRAVALLAQGYIWVFRGTPVLVQLILIYTGLPQLGIRLDVVSSVIVGLALNEAAYQAEILRGGIRAMPRGQFEAARALGMTDGTMMRRIIAPQTLRLVLLPLGNNFNALIKATSLASVISMEELLRRTELMGQFTFKVLETFTVAALYYLLMTTLWGFVQARLERRLNRHALPEDAAAPRLAVADHG